MEANLGWDWWNTRPLLDTKEQKEQGNRSVLAKACLRLLSSADGVLVLDHLHALTLERTLGPDASDQALRMLEGKRSLVLYLLSLAEEARHRPLA